MKKWCTFFMLLGHLRENSSFNATFLTFHSFGYLALSIHQSVSRMSRVYRGFVLFFTWLYVPPEGFQKWSDVPLFWLWVLVGWVDSMVKLCLFLFCLDCVYFPYFMLQPAILTWFVAVVRFKNVFILIITDNHKSSRTVLNVLNCKIVQYDLLYKPVVMVVKYPLTCSWLVRYHRLQHWCSQAKPDLQCKIYFEKWPDYRLFLCLTSCMTWSALSNLTSHFWKIDLHIPLRANQSFASVMLVRLTRHSRWNDEYLTRMAAIY